MATIVTSFSFAVRETASLGQQMLKEPLGINGLRSVRTGEASSFIHSLRNWKFYSAKKETSTPRHQGGPKPGLGPIKSPSLKTLENQSNMIPRGSRGYIPREEAASQTTDDKSCGFTTGNESRKRWDGLGSSPKTRHVQTAHCNPSILTHIYIF